MTKFIVDTLWVFAHFFYWLIVILGIIVGIRSLDSNLLGIILGGIGGLIVATLSCGTIFVLLEINDNLRQIVAKSADSQSDIKS